MKKAYKHITCHHTSVEETLNFFAKKGFHVINSFTANGFNYSFVLEKDLN